MVNPKEGEALIKEFERIPEFSSCLLTFVGSETLHVGTKLAVSIYLKNFIKANWDTEAEDGQAVVEIGEADRSNLKVRIIDILCKCREKSIQSQLIETVVIMAANNYTETWQNLLDVSGERQ